MTLDIYTGFQQGSAEWGDARRGIVTASTMHRFITAKTLQIAQNDTSRAMTMQLIAERITGYTDDNYVSYDMEMGHVNEPIARQIYAEQTGHAVDEVAFMVRTRQGVRVGLSPDGLVGETGVIEIKSRRQKEQLATILNDEVPPENMAQCQTALWVTGRDWLDYVSYCGGMPLCIIRVTPDPEWQNAIFRAAAAFEGTAVLLIDAYNKATKGLPVTERDPYELRIT